jgi:chromosome partitioning protein
MRTIAIAMTKGGVGKTTTAVNLSHGLALQGRRVLLVDADTQGQCAKALGVEYDVTLNEVLLGDATVFEAVTKARQNLDLLPSDHTLTHAALEIARRDHDGHLALAQALQPVADRYDTVVIDAAPGVDAVAVNVLACADEVVAPVALAPAALAGVLDFVRHVERVAHHKPGLDVNRVLPTFHDLRTRTSAESLARLQEHFDDAVCRPIRVNVELAECFAWQKTIFEHAPKSRGAEDYLEFVAQMSPSPVGVG